MKIEVIEVTVKYPISMKEHVIDFISLGLLTLPNEMGRWGEYNLVLYDDGHLELTKRWRGKTEVLRQQKVDISAFLAY